MRIFVDNAAGRIELPTENGKHTLVLYNNYLSVDSEDKTVVEVDTPSGSYTVEEWTKGIPIVWDRDNRSTVVIRVNGQILKYQFQLDAVSLMPEEDIENLLKFFAQMEDTFRYDKEYSVEELFDAIKTDRVSLIIEKTPYSGYDDQSLLKKINETVPMVMDICSHPKQSLRTEEAVLDVNLVKRVNSRTMDHLSSHSEHWKARNLNGLIPNRLRADIFEDEINIYENLFFRMAVDDILKYVHRQAISIKKTIEQNDNAIDWNAYGEELYDYKRMQIFEQLLPDYDVAERQNENNVLGSLLEQWRKLEKNFSTVEASKFFRSISKKKHISRNIKPTNIIKKDSRYNALYRLWCEIQRRIVLEQDDSKGLFGEDEIILNNCYSLYVTALILYVFKLLGCTVSENSKFKVTLNGEMIADAVFDSNNMRYQVKTRVNDYGSLEIGITFIEKFRYEFDIPQKVVAYLEVIKTELPEDAELDVKNQKVIFYNKPSDAEQKTFKNIFHLSHSEKKSLTSEEREAKRIADDTWRPELEELFSSGKIRDARSRSLVINPQFVNMDNSETGIERFTESLLNASDGSVIYTFPIELGDYRNSIKSDRLLFRLLNYGEKYLGDDAGRWGNYRTGILPMAQTEVNSAQRLMKLISLHSSRLQIIWSDQQTVCPICGSKDCRKEGVDSWRCNNPECGVIFGKTKHADGCGKSYEWTRPSINIKSSDLDLEDTLSMMLKKEIIFDRLAITDFDFERQADGKMRYIPICPICGKRSTVRHS